MGPWAQNSVLLEEAARTKCSRERNGATRKQMRHCKQIFFSCFIPKIRGQTSVSTPSLVLSLTQPIMAVRSHREWSWYWSEISNHCAEMTELLLGESNFQSPNIKTSSSICCIMRVTHAHGTERLHCYAFPCKLWLIVNGIQAQRIMYRIYKTKASKKKHFGNRNCFFKGKRWILDIKIVYPEIAEYVGEKRRMTALGEFHTSLITDSSVSDLGPQAKQMYQSKAKPTLNKQAVPIFFSRKLSQKAVFSGHPLLCVW